MTDIDFRVWDKKLFRFMGDGDVMFSDYGDTRVEVNPNSIDYIGDSTHNYYEESRWEILQYTDTYDKNKNRICQKDVVKMNNKLFIIETYNNAFALVSLDGSHFDYMCNMCDMGGKVYEVIGNIYETPELLND